MRTHLSQAPAPEAGARSNALRRRVYARADYDSAAERFARGQEGLASGTFESSSPRAPGTSSTVAATHGDVEPRAVPAGLVESALYGGRPLEPSTRVEYESRFGVDFSRVKVHTDESAARSAHALGASAYTVGHDIVFGRGMFRPESPEGGRRIAHELAHVAWHSSLGACAPPVLYAQSVRRPAAPTQPAAAPTLLSPRHYTHTVLEGERLGVIVRDEYGDTTVMPLVAARNGIQPPEYRILQNDVLALPPIIVPAHSTRAVAAGETLSEIVLDEYGDAELWPVVAEALGLTDPSRLTAGQSLSLPRVAARGANIPNVLPASVRASSPPTPSTPTPSATPSPSPAPTPDAGTRDAASDAAATDAGATGRTTPTTTNAPAAPATQTPAPTRPPTPPAASPATPAPAPRTPDIPQSPPTTPGRGSTPNEQAADEWNRFPSVRTHFRRGLPDYLNIREPYRAAGIANPAEYIARNIGTITFFGRRTQGHQVHMQPVLNAAEQSLNRAGIVPQFLAQPASSPPLQGFVPRAIRGATRLSNHATGHAIDIAPSENPMIRNPQARNNPRRLADAAFVVVDAVTGVNLRTLPRTVRQQPTAPTAGGTPARLPPASQYGPAEVEAMRRAGVQFHATFNEAWMRRERARLRQLRGVASPSAEEQAALRRLERLDEALTVLEQEARARRWGINHLLDVARSPGFVSLEYELIEALRSAGMRWGGDYEDSRDFMHFELDGWI